MSLSFENELNKKIKSQLISPKVLLDKLRLFDEESRKSSQYQDPTYLPFYFYLSRFLFPKSILQIGLNLGLEICCFLYGNKDVESFFGFQSSNDNFYSERLAFSNIKDITKKIKTDYYYGKIYDNLFLQKAKSFDLILLTEKSNFDQIKESVEMCWEKLNMDGYLVMDYLNYDKKINKIFMDFCKSKNTDGFVFKTRYGTGILRK